MDDKLDVPLEDAELLAEVELTTNLIIAASEAEAPLTQAKVDQLLGIRPEEPQVVHGPVEPQVVRGPVPPQQRRP